MYAIRQHAFGGPEVLVGETLPDLEPGAAQARIAVAASGVHLVDTMLRRGGSGPMAPPELPTIPGREVAGVVDLIADGVEPDWLGRRVVAHLGQVPGGYAEQALTTADVLIPIPDGLDDAEAVALVGTGRTALGILAEAAITADDVVLIPAAAGGIGWLLVQAARNAGATVIAAASTTKLDRVRTLQPEVLLDYTAADWADRIAPAPTVILDGVGGEVGRTALESIAPGGRIVMFGLSSGAPTRLATGDLITRSISAGWALGPRMAARPGGIGALARSAVERGGKGDWTPLVTRYRLAEAAQAHRDLESRRTVGKVVLITGRADQATD